jgi:hypothetical protein
MTSATLIKKVTVALNFPTVISVFIVYANAIVLAMQQNPIFATLVAKITQLSSNLKILENLEAACNTKPPTASVAARNGALLVVQNDLRTLRNDVQNLADADPVNAQAIIESSGMSVKKPATHNGHQNTAADGVDEGSVDLTAEGAGVHEWRMSTDDETWVLLPASFTSKTTVSDLTPGLVYYFQNRRIQPNHEKAEWSQSVKIRVR